MKHYKFNTYWENQRRQSKLTLFRELIVTYFNNIKPNNEWLTEARIENDTARQARTDINLMIDEVSALVHAADIVPVMTVTPPPAIGGRIQKVHLLMNMFLLDKHQLSPHHVDDVMLRAIGVYQSDTRHSIHRTINPLWWVKMLLMGIAHAPFSILSAAGFDADRAERSVLGKLVKGLLMVITAVASLLVIADLLGWLEWIKDQLDISAPFWRTPDQQ